MSCTENESGPFVVFFLPAVVGCLTILLARRWANSQVSNTSSTAISRRRKIIKDPLVKRLLPPIATKMVAPGAKKSSGTTKKGAVPQVSDEDINGKRTRPRLSPPSAALTHDVKMPENPLPPKHIPFPCIPQDGEMLFEVMSFVFTTVAMGLQFLNLYRTMWWLPHSYTTQAMNFYLIDPHLVAFIVTLLSRRLLLSVSMALLRCLVPAKKMPHAIIAARQTKIYIQCALMMLSSQSANTFRISLGLLSTLLFIVVTGISSPPQEEMFVLGVVLGALAWCIYFIIVKYPLLKIFYLCYPAVIYFILFGFTLSPFLELYHTDTPLMHSCSHEPEQIRTEVEVHIQDFNMRVKKILFNSILGAYYSSFVPCCFAQSYLHYDAACAAQQVGLVWGALCGRYAAQLLPAAHVDAPHRAAVHLGRWTLYSVSESDAGEVPDWSSGKWWRRGARVRTAGCVYEADAALVCALPGNGHHARFYSVFNNPSKLLCLLVCLQLALVATQLCLLFSSFAWHYFLAVLILLFINYYTLFKMARDYLVAWKVYKAENMIQDKNISVQSNNLAR